jgi:hypothetical protein
LGDKSVRVKARRFLADGDTIIALTELTIGNEEGQDADMYTVRTYTESTQGQRSSLWAEMWARAAVGFVGLRIVPWLWNLPPNDRRYYPVYVACVELGVPFCTQIGHTGPLCPSEPGPPIPYLDDVLLEFPDLVVVGGHVGYPWIDEVISLATKYPNFYVDTSAYAVHRLPAALVDYMRGRGRTRVLFGTNYPMLTPTRVAPTTPSPCPHANTTFVCIEMDGFVANFNARQYPSGSIALR